MENMNDNRREQTGKDEPPKESFIGDSLENSPGPSGKWNSEKSTCIWCEVEKKSGKKIGDVTLAELTESSIGNFMFDFVADVTAPKLRLPQPCSPHTTADSPQLSLPTPASLPVRSSPQCQHSFTLRGGRMVCLSMSSGRACSSGWGGGGWLPQRALSERNPLLVLIGTLTDIFIAITFTLTCWILIAKARDLGS